MDSNSAGRDRVWTRSSFATRFSVHHEDWSPAVSLAARPMPVIFLCSSVKRALRIAPSESGASLSRNSWSELPGAGQAARPSASLLSTTNAAMTTRFRMR